MTFNIEEVSPPRAGRLTSLIVIASAGDVLGVTRRLELFDVT